MNFKMGIGKMFYFCSMIYPENFEDKIGFSSIRLMVAEKCLSEAAREQVMSMQFSSDFDEIVFRVRETAEMLDILRVGEDLPMRNLKDLRKELKRVQVEGMYMEGLDLYHLKCALEQVRAIRNFITSYHEKPLALLKKRVKDVAVFSNLITYIDRIVDTHGVIQDTASKELAEIRVLIRKEQVSIGRKLDGIMKKAKESGWTDKGLNPTVRDGRLVIPVEVANKRKIHGIIHDESGTGRTAYVEPAEVVEANNKLKELEGRERREIIRILVEITDGIRPYVEHITTSFEVCSVLDFVRAKAFFARLIDACLPRILPHAHVDWREAVHPLLELHLRKEKRKAVPLKVSLNERDRVLLISGPNAGGKSVCLKTLGLLQYMLQVGLLVPMDAESTMGVFQDLFIDIGDQQSIDNDLSTYSSHLTNMKYFLQHGSKNTLVLIDEFGTGTEPQIGGAIAEGILLELNKKEVFGLVSTHYANLKHCAAETLGIVNGAMLYDQHRMQPLFQLEIGSPGSSFAVEIARKIGLPENIIREAETKLGQEVLNFDKYLREIIRDKTYWGKKRENIRRQNRQLEQLVERYTVELAEANKKEKEILAQAKVEAAKLLKEANAAIEQTIRVIKESHASKEKTSDARKELEIFKKELDAKVDSTTDKRLRQLNKHRKEVSPKGEKQKESRELEVKDKVKLIQQGSLGEVVELKGAKVVVALGDMKVVVKRSDVERVSERVYRSQSRLSAKSDPLFTELSKKKLNFKPYLDVRGMRAEEALQAVSCFLDDALVMNSKELRILHGTGTGALRQAIREFLDASDIVVSARDEHVQQGGAGITVVKTV